MPAANAPSGTPPCGPPLPWDCSLLQNHRTEDPDTELPDTRTEGSAVLPPFVGTSLESRPPRHVPTEPEAGFASGWLVLLACALVLACVALLMRRSR